MIELLIKKIILRLSQRSEKCLRLSIVEKPPEEKVFLHYGKVILTDVDAAFCRALFAGNVRNEWGRWLKQAKEFEVIIELHLFEEMGDWFTSKWIVQCPYKLFSHDGKRLVYVSKRIICYQDIVILPEKACLVIESGQIMTPLACEAFDQKQMIQFERL